MIGYCTPVEINNDGNGSPTNGGYQGCVPWDSVSCAATAKCVGCVWSNGQYMCESFDPLTTAEDEYPSEAPNTDVLCGNGAVEGYPDYVEPEQPDPESTDPEQPYPE